MLIESAGPRLRLVQPRSFAGLMTLYAANYVSLRQLLGDLRGLRSALVSNSPSDLRIYLRVCERSCYTTSLYMTYWLGVGGQCKPNPDLKIRIYHDARLAEAVSCRHRPQPGKRERVTASCSTELLRRWSLNILLRKWLEHCLDHGHRFAAYRHSLPVYLIVKPDSGYSPNP